MLPASGSQALRERDLHGPQPANGPLYFEVDCLAVVKQASAPLCLQLRSDAQRILEGGEQRT
jgi:hypothetical protein